VADASSAELYLGLDLGTSGLKAVAIDPSGVIVAKGSQTYLTRRPESGAAEQAPGDWLDAAVGVLADLADAADPARWRGIGLAGMIPTLVTTDSRGEPTGPAITWQDSRAAGFGDALRERYGADALYQVTGQWVDGRYLLPMYLRVAATDPGRAAVTATLLSAKDYLYSRLTGQAVTDPSTASGFACYDLSTSAWHEGIVAVATEQAGRVLPALPPVAAPGSSLPLLPALADRLGCEQVPVCLGAADSVLGAHGLGVRHRGQVGYVAGTSSVILGVTDRPVFDSAHRFLVTPMTEPDRWGLEMDLLATGDGLNWLTALTGGERTADLVALAATVEPRDAPVVLPYLSPGEQGALWDDELSGTFIGVTLAHGPGQLARGLLNGIILESRRCIEVLKGAAGFDGELRLGGGSASDPGFLADLANATRRRVVRPAGADAPYSAIGAAQLAALSVAGLDLAVGGRDQIQAAWTQEQAKLWDGLWARHEQARLAITPYYHARANQPPAD
jgi:xylulokinase